MNARDLPEFKALWQPLSVEQYLALVEEEAREQELERLRAHWVRWAREAL